MYKFLLNILFVGLLFNASSQQTVVEGKVYEDSTQNPLPFAKIFFLGTQVGTTSDFDGHFSLSINERQLAHDSIMVSYLGYISQVIPIQRGLTQEIEIHLTSTLFVEIEEVTANAGENVAWRYLRKIIENKENNNPDNLDFYQHEQYAKIRFDLNNFTDRIKKNILLRPFDYIWDNTKVTDDSVTYLPVLMTEKHSQHYHRKSPFEDKTYILGEKTTGLAGPQLLKFTGDLYVTPNIYDNFVTILDKSFPSPLNDNYKQNYKFYLMDSTYTDEGVTYKIRFKPKHQRELGFTGEMYIDSGSYAIKEIHLRFDVMSNVNFVRSYYISQYYSKVDNEHWMLTESRVLGDFTVLENSSDLTGFFGRKKAIYSHHKINSEISDEQFRGIEPEIYVDSALYREDEYWNKFRSEELSQEEITLYEVTKRVQNDRAFKVRKNLILTFVSGYIPMGPVQMGIYSLYSYNPVEKSRFKLDLRSNPNWKIPLELTAFGAYGTFDQQFKYGGSAKYNFSKRGISRIGGNYKYDIDQLGRSFNQIAIDHVLSSLVQIGETNSRNYVEQFSAFYEQSIITGLLLRGEYFYRNYQPTAGNRYMEFVSPGVLQENPNYSISGISATLKFSQLNKDIRGDFYDRDDFYETGRKIPDIAIRYEYADKELFGSSFDYQKVKLSIRQRLNANKLGYLNYSIEAGKTVGTIPHIGLDLPFGNQLVLSDQYAFNLMRFMEFAADQYAMAHLTHHFDGLILDRIPLINKLKWRSFVFGKTYIGSLSAANDQGRYLFPSGLTSLKDPYYEVGFGLENIFKFARIDFIWRLTPGIDEYYWFMVKPSFKFSF